MIIWMYDKHLWNTLNLLHMDKRILKYLNIDFL